MKMKKKNKKQLTPEEREQLYKEYIAYIFTFFALMEGLKLAGHELHKGYKEFVRQEQKKHLGKMLTWIDTWNAQVKPKNRLAYSKEVQDMFSDIGAMVMDVMITTAAVPPKQMDYFLDGVKKLQIMVENQENTRLAKLKNDQQ